MHGARFRDEKLCSCAGWRFNCGGAVITANTVNKSGAPNFFIQHDKVEDSKLHRYLETFGRALDRGENYNFSNGQEINHKV